MTKTVDEHFSEERKFLHDLSNKLVVVQGMGSFLGKTISRSESSTDKDIDRSEKLKKATSEMIKMITERRDYIHSLTDD